MSTRSLRILDLMYSPSSQVGRKLSPGGVLVGSKLSLEGVLVGCRLSLEGVLVGRKLSLGESW